MSIKCGWASIDERGRASGGQVGDQTGVEVKTGSWYSFGQNYVIRFKSRSKAEKAARVCKVLCNGNYVGYDQSNRTSLYKELKKLNWDYTKLHTKCETDCSAMIAAIVNTIGIKVSPDIWTGNMVAALKATGEFTILKSSKYLTSDRYLMKGDIIVNTARHVIMALENGSATTSKKVSASTVPTVYLHKGSLGENVKNLQRCLNKTMKSKLTIDGSFGPKTEYVVKEFQKKYKLKVDGLYGPETIKKMKSVM